MAIEFAPGEDYLPAGRHVASVAEIEAALVGGFPSSLRRPALFEQWRTLFQAIERIVEVRAQWIDGSFVTRKEEPGDIDLVSHLDGELLDALDPVEWMLLRGLIAGQVSKALHDCDSFFVAVYPEGHPARDAYERALAYWDAWFGADRAGRSKGYIELQLNRSNTGSNGDD
jgi:hypothetical protein